MAVPKETYRLVLEEKYYLHTIGIEAFFMKRFPPLLHFKSTFPLAPTVKLPLAPTVKFPVSFLLLGSLLMKNYLKSHYRFMFGT